jgi:hypothetical protein
VDIFQISVTIIISKLQLCNFTSVVNGDCVARSLVVCVMWCQFVLCLLAYCRFMNSDYALGIFKLFILEYLDKIKPLVINEEITGL